MSAFVIGVSVMMEVRGRARAEGHGRTEWQEPAVSRVDTAGFAFEIRKRNTLNHEWNEKKYRNKVDHANFSED